jgi:hypothetical protein
MNAFPLAPAPGIVARQLGDAAVLVRLETNRIYELNATGARIWDLIAAGTPRAELVGTLAREFGGNAAGIGPAVDELVAALHAEGLLAPRSA